MLMPGYVMKLMLVFCGTILLASCALFFGNTNREVHIDSEPQGANIYVNGIFYAKTPGKILLAKVPFNAQKIVITKPGYESGAIWIKSKFQKVGCWNFLFPPAFIIDMSSGTMFALDSEDLNQTLILKESQIEIKQPKK
jgi:hypothetical protein